MTFRCFCIMLEETGIIFQVSLIIYRQNFRSCDTISFLLMKHSAGSYRLIIHNTSIHGKETSFIFVQISKNNFDCIILIDENTLEWNNGVVTL